jgi:hypothetical protein
MSGYSVFIPRMFSNIGESRIRRVFHDNNIGNVERVDLVSKTSNNGDTYNMAFVHFNIMYDTESSAKFRDDVENSETKTKLVYDDPWFWLVLPFQQKETKILNPRPSDFVVQHNPSSNSHRPMTYATREEQQWANSGMVPMWTMTPQGPIVQWGYPQYMPCDMRTAITQSYDKTNILKKALKLVPRQVAYAKHYDVQRSHQRKRLNISPAAAAAATTTTEAAAHDSGDVVFGVGIDKVLEEEMERQNDYHNQMELYEAMDREARKEEGEV